MKNALLMAIALGFAAGFSGPAFSQSDPDMQQGGNETVQADDYTLETLDPAKPFGDMEVDMTRPPNEGEFTDEEMADIRARCEFMLKNREVYGPTSTDYCEEQHNIPARTQ